MNYKKIIDEAKNKLINTYNPIEIYIFGSYAWGHPTEESDLDLLVVVDKYNKNQYETMVDGHLALADLQVSKDLLVFTKDEFEKYSKDKSRLCYKIKNKGKLIYAKA